MVQRFLVVMLAVLVAACGGDDTFSGGGSPFGPTMNTGEWTLTARHTITVEEAITDQTVTSTIRVNADGTVNVESTDAVCTLAIAVNGNTMTYQERCPVTGSTCIVELLSIAGISGNALSGPFGPNSFICGGRRISYSGRAVILTVLPFAP